MDEKSLYREHRGVDIAVHAHEVEKGRWRPRVVLFEPTIGATRELQAPEARYLDEHDALEAGMRLALETVDGMHAAFER